MERVRGMSRANVLLIERRRAQHTSFFDALKKRYDVISVLSGNQALISARDWQPDIVVLDAISMHSPGDRICKQIKTNLSTVPVIHLLPEPHESGADVVLVMPFTARKLVNAIERLLHQSPDDEAIKFGPFVMNPTSRVLSAHGQETQLTPKLAELVSLFVRNAGKTLDRKSLMEQVWHTDYLGDTRTLDVHIRWFRRAIETDPGRPVYLKTVRGVGYRLELPAAKNAPLVSNSLELHSV
jgi:DNA-binding response OmpR family regulator